ncbi:MAG: zf-HC2 domain-containing protein, partial [Vicinamibacterales bacterium]|nr:zf-HC2 domain-containing protein [Vicinamibacterales bacterium]
MMQQLSCEIVREQLAEFHDGELDLDQQIVVQTHLRECVACAIESAEIVELGRLMRQMAADLPAAPPDAHLSAVLLERVRVEERLSFRVWVREIFDDMHLVWPALGATAATVVCLLGAMGVMQAANREHPESLAGMISHLAAPAVPAGEIAGPVQVSDSAGGEAVFALAAAVTRGGRIQSIEQLAVEQGRELGVRPEVVLAMLEAASRAQFTPAGSGRGAPIAVSMVWVMAPNAGSGKLDYELLRVPTGRGTGVRPAAAGPK